MSRTNYHAADRSSAIHGLHREAAPDLRVPPYLDARFSTVRRSPLVIRGPGADRRVGFHGWFYLVSIQELPLSHFPDGVVAQQLPRDIWRQLKRLLEEGDGPGT